MQNYKKYLFFLLLITLLCKPSAESYAEIFGDKHDQHGRHIVLYDAQAKLEVTEILNFIHIKYQHHPEQMSAPYIHFTFFVWDCEKFVSNNYGFFTPRSTKERVLRECNEDTEGMDTLLSKLQATFIRHSRIKNSIRQLKKEHKIHSNNSIEIQKQLKNAENIAIHVNQLLQSLKVLKNYDKEVISSLQDLSNQVKNNQNPIKEHFTDKPNSMLSTLNKSQIKTVEQIITSLQFIHNNKDSELSIDIDLFLKNYFENFSHATSNNYTKDNKTVDSLIQTTDILKNLLNQHLVTLQNSYTDMLQKIQTINTQIAVEQTRLNSLWTGLLQIDFLPKVLHFVTNIPPVAFSFNLYPTHLRLY